jgi:hypothetical protein
MSSARATATPSVQRRHKADETSCTHALKLLLKKPGGGFNRSVQHGRVFGVVRIGGTGVANLGPPGLSAVREKELWDRWKAGESILATSPGLWRSLPALFTGYSKPLAGSPHPSDAGRGGAQSGRAGGDFPGTCGRRGVDARYRGPLGPGCLDRKPGSGA